jgi:hypothetical protein
MMWYLINAREKYKYFGMSGTDRNDIYGEVMEVKD